MRHAVASRSTCAGDGAPRAGFAVARASVTGDDVAVSDIEKSRGQRIREVLLGGVHVVWGGLFSVVSVSFLAASLDVPSARKLLVALAILFAVVTVGEVLLGLAIAAGRGPRARATMALGTLALSVLAFYAFFFGPLALVPGIALWATMPWAKRQIPVREVSARAKRYGTVVAIFGVALALTAAFRGEISGFLWDLKVDRWEARCAAQGDIEACGWWALDVINDPASFDAMRRAREAFEKTCRGGGHRGCEFVARMSSDASYAWFYGAGHYLGIERQRIANAACEKGDVRGCVVTSVLRRDLEPDRRELPVEASRRLCEDANAAACFALGNMVQSEAAATAACQARWGMNCALGHEPRCLDGDFGVCPTDGLDAEIHRALVEVSQDHRNPARYAAAVRASDAAERCEAGSATACYALGLAATADVNPFTDEPAVRSMEATFGRACALGAAAGCRIFALRLLDRPVAVPASDRTRAAELLQTGCALDDELSCWFEALAVAQLPEDLDRYRDAAERMCRLADFHPEVDRWACVSWAHVLAHDLDAEPWLALDSIGYAQHRDLCLQHKHARSCVEAARMVLGRGLDASPSVLPLMVQGARMAEIACRASSREGCQLLFEYAESTQRYGMKSPEQYREAICTQQAWICEDSW